MQEKERLIEIRNLSKLYGGEAAVDEISLTIEKGEIFGIIGRSGAGKSTLLRCLAGLEEWTSGTISLFGQPLEKRGDRRLFYRSIGMIFQHFNLFSSRTCRENISYPLEIAGWEKEKREARVEELLVLVGLTNQGDLYPSQMSGGQKQRVGIARALAHSPHVLLCDEPTSALDPSTTREVLALLRSIHKRLGITIVLITHEMQVIKEICHKVAILSRGKVVEQGRVATIFTNPKEAVTRELVETTPHEVPSHFFDELSPNKKIVRLRFKGKKADEPIISEMVERFRIKANILLGWIDCLETTIVGTLVVQLIGEPEGISQALSFLAENSVACEELSHAR